MKQTVLFTFFVLIVHCVLSQPILRVTPSGAGTRSGDSWTNALAGTDLPGHVATATAGTQFWVAAGTYKPTTTTDRGFRFNIASGVQVYGGFVGSEADLESRILTQPSSTTLSGDIGVVDDNSDNSYQVVVFRNASADTRLDGVTVSNGNTNGSLIQNKIDPLEKGKWLYDINILERGAVFNINGNPLFTNCTFSRNMANTPLSRGGGMFNYNSSPTLINCVFDHNASYLGGGMFNKGTSTPKLINCSFWGNFGFECGGIFNDDSSNVYMENCTISQNTSRVRSIIITPPQSATARNCIIWANPGHAPQLGIAFNRTYSLTDDEINGISAYGINPYFVDPANGNFRLQPSSPAINAGDPNTTGSPITDLAGQARVQGGRVDMGAYESVSCPHVSCLPFIIQRQR